MPISKEINTENERLITQYLANRPKGVNEHKQKDIEFLRKAANDAKTDPDFILELARHNFGTTRARDGGLPKVVREISRFALGSRGEAPSPVSDVELKHAPSRDPVLVVEDKSLQKQNNHFKHWYSKNDAQESSYYDQTLAAIGLSGNNEKYIGYVVVLLGANYSGFYRETVCRNNELFAENVELEIEMQLLRIAYLIFKQYEHKKYIESVLEKQKSVIESKYAEEKKQLNNTCEMSIELSKKLNNPSQMPFAESMRKSAMATFAAQDKEKMEIRNAELKELTALRKACEKAIEEEKTLSDLEIFRFMEQDQSGLFKTEVEKIAELKKENALAALSEAEKNEFVHASPLRKLSKEERELFSRYEKQAGIVRREMKSSNDTYSALYNNFVETLELVCQQEKDEEKLIGADTILTKYISRGKTNPSDSKDMKKRVDTSYAAHVTNSLKQKASQFIEKHINPTNHAMISSPVKVGDKADSLRATYLALKAKYVENQDAMKSEGAMDAKEKVFEEYKAKWKQMQESAKCDADFKAKFNVSVLNDIDNSEIGYLSPSMIRDEKHADLISFTLEQYRNAATQAAKQNIFKVLEMLLKRGATLTQSPVNLWAEGKADYTSIKNAWISIKLSLMNTPAVSELQVLVKKSLMEYCDASINLFNSRGFFTRRPALTHEAHRIDLIYNLSDVLHKAYMEHNDVELQLQIVGLKAENLSDNNGRSPLSRMAAQIENQIQNNNILYFSSTQTRTQLCFPRVASPRTSVDQEMRMMPGHNRR